MDIEKKHHHHHHHHHHKSEEHKKKLPKINLPKVHLPKINLPKVHAPTYNTIFVISIVINIVLIIMVIYSVVTLNNINNGTFQGDVVGSAINLPRAVNDVKGCRQLCRANSDCVAYTYKDSNKTCTLKNFNDKGVRTGILFAKQSPLSFQW